MAVDDNISSSLKSFFRMRTFLVFSNFDISVNSKVGYVMVIFFSFNWICSISSCSSFVISLSIMVDIYSNFHTVTYGDILWIFILFSLSICNIVSFLSLISVFGCIWLRLVPLLKFFNFTWIHLEWYSTRSIDTDWNITFLCFLGFIDGFELCFEFRFSFKHLFLFFCSIFS